MSGFSGGRGGYGGGFGGSFNNKGRGGFNSGRGLGVDVGLVIEEDMCGVAIKYFSVKTGVEIEIVLSGC